MSTLPELTKSYLDVILEARSLNTYKTYFQRLKTFVEIVGSDAPLTTETYVTFLKKTFDMNPASRDLCRTAIMGLYEFHSETHPEINLAALRTANKRYVKRRGPRLPKYDGAAIEKLLTHVETIRTGDLRDLRDRALILTLADTGLRVSELCSMRRGTLDWDESKAIIIGKRDKEAVINVSNRARVALLDYLRARAELDGATGKPLNSLPLFARHDKGAGQKVKELNPGGVWAMIKKRCNQAGVQPDLIHPHSMRHYFVSAVYAASGDIRLTQELARHQSITTTSRYTHLSGKTDKAYDEIFNH